MGAMVEESSMPELEFVRESYLNFLGREWLAFWCEDGAIYKDVADPISRNRDRPLMVVF